MSLPAVPATVASQALPSRVVVETFGSGRMDLVLIHGWAMHGGIFAGLADELAQRFRVHVVDLPGHGHADGFRAGMLDPRACADVIAELTPPAIWIGWSLGGLVAMHAALTRPNHVRGLVALAASPCFVSNNDWAHGVQASVFDAFATALETDHAQAIERFLALETLGSPQAHDELRALKHAVFTRGEPDRAALREGLHVLQRTDLRRDLASLAVPNLWIGGRRDRLVPAAAMRWAAQSNAQGRHLEFASGHAPFLSATAAVAAAIGAFATGTGRS